MSEVLVLTSENFDSTINDSDKPVIVDFWAGWCGPCRALAPIVEQVAEEYGDKVIVAKLDVDAEPAISQRYRIMSIPCVILFKDGEPAAQSMGAVPKEEFISRFADYLK